MQKYFQRQGYFPQPDGNLARNTRVEAVNPLDDIYKQERLSKYSVYDIILLTEKENLPYGRASLRREGLWQKDSSLVYY